MIKWVIRLAIVAGLLGLVGSVIIVLSINRNRKSAATSKEVNETETATKKAVDTARKKTDTLVIAAPVVVEKKDSVLKDTVVRDTVKIVKPTAATVVAGEKATIKVNHSKEVKKAAAAKKIKEQPLFNVKELQHILATIYRTKATYGIASNCVQIYITDENSSKKTISQIEKYLKRKKFTIAGREIISEKVRGVKIRPYGGCIRMTIGRF